VGCVYFTIWLINPLVKFMQDDLSRTFSALADPTRRAMLAQLSRGEANVSELARPFLQDMSLPAVTKHLKVLENAGLVSKGRNAQWRPCRINGEPLRAAVDCMEQYRAAWEDQLDRLGAYLKSKTKGAQHGRKK
jgi:DNA-binding transcriptional ArsR family regulator